MAKHNAFARNVWKTIKPVTPVPQEKVPFLPPLVIRVGSGSDVSDTCSALTFSLLLCSSESRETTTSATPSRAVADDSGIEVEFHLLPMGTGGLGSSRGPAISNARSSSCLSIA